MMWLKKSIPNFITILNLLCGSIAIIFILKGEPAIGALLIIWGAVFDFFDGLAARALSAYSDIGKELDSLADVISFGLAPGMIVYYYLSQSLPEQLSWLAFLGMAIPAFSALRLARFNVTNAPSHHFIGLPVPANALFFVGFPLIELASRSGDYLALALFMLQPYFIIASTIVLSLMLVGRFQLISLKFSNLRFKDNQYRFFFIITALILFLVLDMVSIPFVIAAYLLISFTENLFARS